MKTFKCFKCKSVLPIETEKFGTGYASQPIGATGKYHKICYCCCGVMDSEYLLKTGKLSGYLTGTEHKHFSNWHGTFSIPVVWYSRSWHNFAGKNGRTYFWLTYQGNKYHGVQIGHNNQCATIQITKS